MQRKTSHRIEKTDVYIVLDAIDLRMLIGHYFEYSLKFTLFWSKLFASSTGNKSIHSTEC